MKQYYQQHPLRVILFAGLFFRVISALFSQGYGFSDDHFLVIEVAQQWVDGVDTKGWMPWNGNTTASGHSLFYPGLHYLFFVLLKLIGITDPVMKMYLVRFLHAVYSLSIVYFGFKIAKKLGGEELAKKCSWILSLLWFVPLMSVRNSVEMVCIPPLMIATWLLMLANEKKLWQMYLWSGLIAGIAFSIRFQTMTFIGGFGLVLLFQKRIKEAIIWGTGAIVSIFALQGGIDFFVWGRPFAEFSEYTKYNVENARNYINGDWYNYILLLAGLLIPPISLFIFFGLVRFRSWKKYLIVWLPAICFFIFHSCFPNKQERFILPVVPFFVIAGLGSWNDFMQSSAYWSQHQLLHKNLWRWFWIVNTFLLLVLSPSSTKISRVDAMTYLKKKKDYHYFALETTQMWGSVMMPIYYTGKWNYDYEITQEKGAKDLFEELKAKHQPLPEYIVFAEDKDLGKRVLTVSKQVKRLTYEATIESSFLDKTMHVLNPVNVNQTYYIFKIEY